MAVSSLFGPNNFSLFAENLAVSEELSLGGSVAIPGVVAVDDARTEVLAKGPEGLVVLKDSAAVTTNPTWVWLNGTSPQPALVTIKAFRVGSYCICQLLANGLQMAASESPFTATFTLPFPVAAAFTGAAPEVLATSGFDPTSSAIITRCRISSYAGSTNRAQLYIAASADQTVTLGATFVYSGLA
jgi:hypothetical protein